MKSKLFLLTATSFESLNATTQKEIYEDFYKSTYLTIIYMVKDHAATEDIIQDSFLKVIKNMPVMDCESKLKGWIKIVVKNTTLNFLRKNQKNRNEIDSESVYIYDNFDHATGDMSIESEIELKVMTETLKKCLKDLKPEYQVLIELRWKRQLSYKEIAEELEVTEEIVKYKLHRAREVIKKSFQREWGEIK